LAGEARVLRIYTVHHRHEASGSLTGLGEDAILVKEGFSWPAFLVPLIWLVYKRMWIVLPFYIAATAALTILSQSAVVAGSAVFVGNLAVNLVLGLQGNDLYRWTLQRRRYREQAVVVGHNLVTAEQRYFEAVAEAIGRRRTVPGAHGAGAE
jgi:hypothetical protein